MICLTPSLQRLFNVVDELVDEHVGIIRYVRELPREPGAPDFFHFYAESCNAAVFACQKNSPIGGGASADRGIAMAKAIGEAVERYCSAIYNPDDCTLTSADEAPFKCLSPSDFALYTEEQYGQREFPYVPFTNETPVRWTPTIDAETGETWHVPAAMVFMPYFFSEEHGEHSISERISTGLACHCSFEEAAISGIYEVIERDAFTIMWQAGLGMPQIRVETLSEENRDLVERLQRGGGAVTLLNITMDHAVPTVLGVVRRQQDDAPALIFAASTHLDPEVAVRKSLEELAHTWRLAHQLKTKLPRFFPAPNYDNVIDQDDHVHLYCDHGNAHLADFVFASTKHISFKQIESLIKNDTDGDLEVLVGKVRAVDHQVLLADLTTSDVEELGLKVVRAVVPGFHPLFIGHRLRALGGSRLWEVPQRLGYQGIRRVTGDNPAPHPYP